MIRTITITLLLCFAFPSMAGEPSKTEGILPVVLRLMRKDQRDAAYHEILKLGKYRGEGNYKEDTPDDPAPVRHVVVCPQKKGWPIFAVFLRSEYVDNPADLPMGWVVLVASDGAIIRTYCAANYITGEFKDVNGDGVVDNVESWPCDFGEVTIDGKKRKIEAYVVHVLPVAEPSLPILRVAFNLNVDALHSHWGWELRARHDKRINVEGGDTPDRYDIVLGPRGENGRVRPKVRYRWSKEKGTYLGPVGGLDQGFVRLTCSSSMDFVPYPEEKARKPKKSHPVPAHVIDY